jgi:hypothetical protein
MLDPSMCDTSKMLAAERQCLVASMMESLYWMGMECPAKGTCVYGTIRETRTESRKSGQEGGFANEGSRRETRSAGRRESSFPRGDRRGRTILPPISRWKSYSAVFSRFASSA